MRDSYKKKSCKTASKDHNCKFDIAFINFNLLIENFEVIISNVHHVNIYIYSKKLYMMTEFMIIIK